MLDLSMDLSAGSSPNGVGIHAQPVTPLVSGTFMYYTIPSITPSGDFEIEVEFSVNDLTGNEVIFSGTTVGNNEIVGRCNGANVEFFAYVGTTLQTIISIPIPSVTELHTVVFKYAGTTPSISVDGGQPVTGTWALNSSQTIANIGARATPTNFFNGIIREFKLWDGGDRTTGTLRRWYRLNEPTVSIVKNVLGGTDTELLFYPATTVNSPWVNNGDGTYSIDGSQSGNTNLYHESMLTGAAVGKQYIAEFEITGYSAGQLRIVSGADSTAYVSANGLHSQLITKTDATANFNFQADLNFNGTVRGITVKEVSGYGTTVNQSSAVKAAYTYQPWADRWVNEWWPQMVRQSINLNGGSWGAGGNLTRTSNYATAPDGNMTATRCQLSTANGHQMDQTLNRVLEEGKTYTLSLYVKGITISGGSMSDFQLGYFDNGTGVNFQNFVVDDSATWNRLVFTFTVPVGANVASPRIRLIGFAGGSDLDEFYIWGCQLEEGSVPTQVVETNLIEGIAYYVGEDDLKTSIIRYASQASGALYDMTDISTLWQDTAGTTAVTTDGDPVRRIDDISGNGNNWTQGGVSTIVPTYRVDANGTGYVEFDGGDYMDGPSGLVTLFNNSIVDMWADFYCTTPSTQHWVLDATWAGGSTGIIGGFTADTTETVMFGARPVITGHPFKARNVFRSQADKNNGVAKITINNSMNAFANVTGSTPGAPTSVLLGENDAHTQGLTGGIYTMALFPTYSQTSLIEGKLWEWMLERLPKYQPYLIAGQSNAQGRGDSASSPTVAAGTAYEFDTTDGFVELNDPVGSANTGSAWPAMCDGLYAATGKIPMMVAGPVGGSAQSVLAEQSNGYWQDTSTTYTNAISKAAQMMNNMANYGLPHTGRIDVVWSQGERDAAQINGTPSTYSSALYSIAFDNMWSQMKNDLSELNGVLYTPLMYMSRTGTQNSGDSTGFQNIRAAQDAIPSRHHDVFMVFTNAVNFPGESKMSDDLHYNQTGYNEMGTAFKTYLSS